VTFSSSSDDESEHKTQDKLNGLYYLVVKKNFRGLALDSDTVGHFSCTSIFPGVSYSLMSAIIFGHMNETTTKGTSLLLMLILEPVPCKCSYGYGGRM
jgi:hypothetical protein